MDPDDAPVVTSTFSTELHILSLSLSVSVLVKPPQVVVVVVCGRRPQKEAMWIVDVEFGAWGMLLFLLRIGGILCCFSNLF
jgi:hypothetical protein